MTRSRLAARVISILLLRFHQHGRHDVTCKPRIFSKFWHRLKLPCREFCVNWQFNFNSRSFIRQPIPPTCNRVQCTLILLLYVKRCMGTVLKRIKCISFFKLVVVLQPSYFTSSFLRMYKENSL